MREKDIGPVLKSGRTAKENGSSFRENKEKTLSDRAAGIFLAIGSVVILLFLCFGGKTEGADAIGYANSTNAEYGGAVQAMSYMLDNGNGQRNEEKSREKEKHETTENAEINSTNAENTEKTNEKGWNFWEFLSRSVEKFFISKGIIRNEKSQK